MTITELCKVCDEYDHNLTKMSLLKSNIECNGRYSHLKWAIDRDTKALNKLINRQTEIQEQILDNDKIVF